MTPGRGGAYVCLLLIALAAVAVVAIIVAAIQAYAGQIPTG